MDATTLNLNAAECVKVATNVGSKVYTNICTGSVTNVPWGSADWLGAVAIAGLSVFMVGLLFFLGVLLWKIIQDVL